MSANPISIELNSSGAISGYGGFIDFHYDGNSEDYTSRIIEEGSGKLSIYAPNGIYPANNIYTRHLYPNESLTYIIGQTSNPYKQVSSKLFSTSDGVKECGKLYSNTIGTTSTIGNSYLVVGNNTASGTANNSRGYVRLYGSSSGYTQLETGSNTTSNVTLTLPSASGKIPVVSLSGTTLTITT